MDENSVHETRLWAYSTSLTMIAMIALMLLLMTSAYAAELTYGPYRADVIKIIDGDTVQLDVAMWPRMSYRVNLRLAGVNTPEKKGRVPECEKAAGQKATNFTQNWLRGMKMVVVSELKEDKYGGRMLGKLAKPNGEDLAQALIKTGHAKPYDGGKRGPWCSD
jgi:micrococcal nuclease